VAKEINPPGAYRRAMAMAPKEKAPARAEAQPGPVSIFSP